MNNQAFSKQLLTIITDHKDTLDDDVYQLSKFMLISSINSSEDNPIFEMNDVVSEKIMEMNGDNNKIYWANIIAKLSKPKSTHLPYVRMTANTILENLTILVNSSEKYNIDLYAMLNLRCMLAGIHVNSHNFYRAKQMVDWFEQKDKNKEFKLHKMSEYQKYRYVKYLNVISVYNSLLANYEETISYSTRALKILDALNDDTSFRSLKTLDTLNDDDYTSFQFHLISNLAGSQISLGNIEIAEQYIKQMKQL